MFPQRRLIKSNQLDGARRELIKEREHFSALVLPSRRVFPTLRLQHHEKFDVTGNYVGTKLPVTLTLCIPREKLEKEKRRERKFVIKSNYTRFIENIKIT